MKYLLLGIAILYTTLSFSQSPDEGYFFGGFESNSQWLLYDKGLNFEQPATFSKEIKTLANSFLDNPPLPRKI